MTVSLPVELQQSSQRIPHLAPGHHGIHKTVLHLKFRPLKALRQRFADGLLNDPGPGKAR